MTQLEQQTSVTERLRVAFDQLSPGQQRVAAFMLERSVEAAMLSAAQIGERVDVSASTVVRTAQVLGYDGFPELQRALQESVLGRIDTFNRVRYITEQVKATEWVKDDRLDITADEITIYARVMQADIDSIQATLHHISRADFDATVDVILAARRIYVIGLRGSAPLAQFLSLGLRELISDTFALDLGIGDLPDRLLGLTADDLVIAISYTRYMRETLRCLEYAREVGASTVVFTDSPLSPAAKLANHVLITQNPLWFFQMSAAPVSLINALLIAVAIRKSNDLSGIISHLEKVIAQFDLFYSDHVSTRQNPLVDRLRASGEEENYEMS